jgi:hypothetical protein
VETFVVRTWPFVTEAGSAREDLRGEVEHVRSGHVLTFAGADQLVALLRDVGSELWRGGQPAMPNS